jgi:SAM-dependent methyltransferase
MFNIRDCINEPLLNIVSSNIDNIYYAEMRNFLNNCIDSFISNIDINDKKIVDIGLTGHAKRFENCIFHTIDIDIKNNPTYHCDITVNNENKIPSNYYDITFCNEVLEHTSNPLEAIKELIRITNINGLIVISTPYNFRIHGPLYDTIRFSEWFYKNYFNKENFEILQLVALEDVNRKLFPISYFCVIKKL